MIELKLDTTETKKSKVEIDIDGHKKLVLLGSSPLPTIQKALEQTQLSIMDIDRFSAKAGPGSFTGVRIGAAVINALNFALNKNAELIEPIYS